MLLERVIDMFKWLFESKEEKRKAELLEEQRRKEERQRQREKDLVKDVEQIMENRYDIEHCEDRLQELENKKLNIDTMYSSQFMKNEEYKYLLSSVDRLISLINFKVARISMVGRMMNRYKDNEFLMSQREFIYELQSDIISLKDMAYLLKESMEDNNL